MVFGVQTLDPALTAWWQPEGRNMRNPPLTGMAMPTECEIGVMSRGQLVQNIRRMRQNEGKAPGLRRGNTSKISTVKGRIVESHDR